MIIRPTQGNRKEIKMQIADECNRRTKIRAEQTDKSDTIPAIILGVMTAFVIGWVLSARW